MPKSASPPGMRTCRNHGPRPESEFDRLPTRWDYYCRTCRENAKPPAAIPLGDGTSKIPLVGDKGKGLFQIVDDADVPQLAVHRWRASGTRRPDGSWSNGPYAVTQINRKMISAHQMLTGKNGIDHVNRKTLDNTRKNLREATPAENLANQGKRRSSHKPVPTSRFKGVYWQKQVSKWHVNAGIGGTQLYCGLFTDEERAGRAHDAAILKHQRDRTPTNVDLGLLPPLPPGVVIECSCRGCLGKPGKPRRRRGNGEVPADLAERMSPELRATLGSMIPGNGEGSA